MQNVKKLKFQGDWSELIQKLCLSNNPGKKIWKKVEKSSKTGQDNFATREATRIPSLLY